MTDLRLGSMVAEDAGEGPAVVMVHGLGGSSNSFQTLMAALAGHRVLRPDLPGSGRSGRRPGRPGLSGLAAAVMDCLRAGGVGRAHFVGHSMGTLICQDLAVRSPETVASLTLFGPILEPPPAARMAGITARMPRKQPIWFTPITRMYCSREVVSRGPAAATPALFTSTSTRPKASTASATKLDQLSSALTSQCR